MHDSKRVCSGESRRWKLRKNSGWLISVFSASWRAGRRSSATCQPFRSPNCEHSGFLPWYTIRRAEELVRVGPPTCTIRRECSGESRRWKLRKNSGWLISVFSSASWRAGRRSSATCQPFRSPNCEHSGFLLWCTIRRAEEVVRVGPSTCTIRRECSGCLLYTSPSPRD